MIVSQRAIHSTAGSFQVGAALWRFHSIHPHSFPPKKPDVLRERPQDIWLFWGFFYPFLPVRPNTLSALQAGNILRPAIGAHSVSLVYLYKIGLWIYCF